MTEYKVTRNSRKVSYMKDIDKTNLLFLEKKVIREEQKQCREQKKL